MAWLNKLNNTFAWRPASALAAVALASATLVGCNVGKSDTVTTDATAPNNSAKQSGCTGSFVGSLDAPPHEERIAARNEALRRDGISVTGNDAIDNAATGGGGVDGGMYLEGSFSFETDANCNVIKGDAIIFGYPFGITGTVRQDRTFSLSYLGPIEGQVNSDNSISGKLLHGGGSEYIYGILNGVFTQNGKI